MAFNDKILEARANKFRNDSGIESDTAIDFEKLLPSLNVLTMFKPMGDDFSGMALKTYNSMFVLINTNQLLGRQRFSIGHELYHLFVQPSFSFELSKAGRFDKRDKEEYNADIFSSYLLMPESGIIKQIPEDELAWGSSLSLATIIKLEQYFGVSRRALLVRLDKIGLIKFKDYEDYLTGVRKSALEFGYSTDLYTANKETRVIGDYGIMAKQLFDAEKISESHYYALMLDIFVDVDKKQEDDGEERW